VLVGEYLSTTTSEGKENPQARRQFNRKIGGVLI
jgi:hypothetical protein